MSLGQVFSFPDPVNETAARVVAAGVVVFGATFLVSGSGWVLAAMMFGFVARVVSGPSLSPLGQLSTRVITPSIERRFGIESRHVPGPRKRFAQGIGVVFTASASITLALGLTHVSTVLIALLVVAASLEAFAAVCLGCIAYSAVWGCDDCDDISERLREAVARS